MAINFALLLFLLISVYSDLRYKKIYNVTIIPAIMVGIGMNVWYFGVRGLGNSLFGLLAGFTFLILFYLLGGIGAGDVKFMAAVGSLKGAGFVLLGGLYGAVLAGIVACAALAARGQLILRLKEVGTSLYCLFTFQSINSIKFDSRTSVHLPYAALLALGMVANLLLLSLQ